MLNGLDLFSGIGGITIALSPWVKTIAYCENDRYAQSVLLSRMQNGSINAAPIWDEVRSLRKEFLPPVDIVSAGFPCQDISVAGHGVGLAGERSGLFNEIVRICAEIRPGYIFLENVPAIRTRGLREVIQVLTDIRYDCRWTCISAKEVGAPFIGKRWFLLAKTHGEALWVQQRRGFRKSRGKKNVYTSTRNSRKTSWSPEGGFKSRIFRASDGIPFGVDRDRCLGNSVVPLQARKAFQILGGL